MDSYLKQYEILYKKALIDLKAAINLNRDFDNGDIELDLEVIIFHLQQSAEKFLKSILSYHEINFPKTHDLEVILRLVLESNLSLTIDEEKLIDLNDYAVEGRYSIIHDDLDNVSEYFTLLDRLKQETILKINNI
jgi:HEPN domain-containing protein